MVCVSFIPLYLLAILFFFGAVRLSIDWDLSKCEAQKNLSSFISVKYFVPPEKVIIHKPIATYNLSDPQRIFAKWKTLIQKGYKLINFIM